MKDNKHHLKSLTVWSQFISMVVCVVLAFSGPKALEPGFTTDQLCDWALAIGRGQSLQFALIAIISMNLIGIYGRMRATKGLGKNEK